MNPMRILPVLVSGALLAGCAGAPESAPQAESVVIEKPKQPATPVPAPVVTYEVALQRGDQAWKSGELDKALMNYVQAASLDRKSALPLLRMASIHEQRKEWPLARQAFEEALKRSPDNAAASPDLSVWPLTETSPSATCAQTWRFGRNACDTASPAFNLARCNSASC